MNIPFISAEPYISQPLPDQLGQKYRSKLAEETGGELFWLGTSNPVSFAPWRVKLKTEVPHVTVVGPSKVYVPGGRAKLRRNRFYSVILR